MLVFLWVCIDGGDESTFAPISSIFSPTPRRRLERIIFKKTGLVFCCPNTPSKAPLEP